MVAFTWAAFGAGSLSPQRKMRALRGAAPLQHQVPHLGHAGLARPAQRDAEEVEHLVLGDR